MLTALSQVQTKFFALPKWQRIVSYLLLTYLIYAIILGLVVPQVAKTIVPEKITQATGRASSVQDIRINPFLLQLQVDQLLIAKQSAQSVTNQNTDKTESIAISSNTEGFIGFEQLSGQINFWHSLVNGAISLSDLHLKAPYVAIEAKQISHDIAGPMTFSFDDILAHVNAQQTQVTNQNEATEQEATALPHILINQLHLDAARVKIVLDKQLTGQQALFSVDDFSVTLAQFDSLSQPLENQANQTRPLQDNRFNLSLHSNDSDEISAQGQLQLLPFAVDGNVKMSKLSLHKLWPFIAEHFEATLAHGVLGFETDFLVKQQAEGMVLKTHQGLIVLNHLDLQYQQQSFIQLPEFAIESIEAHSGQKQVTIANIRSQDLLLNALLDDDGLNIAKWLQPKAIQSESVENTNTAPVQTNTDIVDTSELQHQADPSPTSQASQNNATQSWSIIIDALAINNYDVKIQEQLVTKNTELWHIAPLSFSTTAIHSDLKTPVDYQLALQVNQQGTITSAGSVDLASQTAKLALEIEKLQFKQFQPYVSPWVNLELVDGNLNTQAKIERVADGSVIVDSAIQVSQLQVKDSVKQRELLAWDQLNINHIRFEQQNNKLSVDTVHFTKPFARVVIAKDRSTNIGNLLVSNQDQSPSKTVPAPKTAETPKNKSPQTINEQGASTQQPSADTQAPLAIEIAQIKIEDGAAFFADKSLTPSFASSIEQLNGHVSRLSSSSKQAATVDLTGKIDKYAPVILQGEINPLLEKPFLDLGLQFKDVELTSVNPYSGTYAGYYIDRGQLSLTLDYKLDNNQLLGSNHLVVDQLELGKPSNSSLATSLPVSLAIALLQDSDGVIDLGLDVSGDLDSPSFSFGDIIMTAVTNVITKAVTAPFSLLASLVDTDDELDKVAFAIGRDSLDTKETKKLTELAKALNKRPKLILSIKGEVKRTDDSRALKQQQLLDQLYQEVKLNGNEIGLPRSASEVAMDTRFADALPAVFQKTLKQDPLAYKATLAQQLKDKAEKPKEPLSESTLNEQWRIGLYNMSLNAQPISDDLLGELAHRRALSVKSFLVEQSQVPAARVFIIESKVNIEDASPQATLTLEAK
ncbi:DUF748 domain-containing protein [Shewanella gelidii]|uniref:ATPase n=1 Tax=Shewanella gelidii TaxID=1642821 RepID=A0A917NC67_9GAMM|nr:DUF748 domain-containing protein [Shewanella gelidii]MCL1098656.1 DUF748 domain-containing protein [Shewanella gelidii]GGI86299.1 ATPase [Shewanella gelidii]